MTEADRGRQGARRARPDLLELGRRGRPGRQHAKTPVLAVSNTGPGIVGDCPYPCEYIFRDSLGEAEAIPANIGEYVDVPRTRRPRRSSIPPKTRSAPARPRPRRRPSGRTASKVVAGHGLPERPEIRARQANPNAVMVAASSGEVVVEIIKDLREQGVRRPDPRRQRVQLDFDLGESAATGNGAQSAAAWYSGNESTRTRTSSRTTKTSTARPGPVRGPGLHRRRTARPGRTRTAGLASIRTTSPPTASP